MQHSFIKEENKKKKKQINWKEVKNFEDLFLSACPLTNLKKKRSSD